MARSDQKPVLLVEDNEDDTFLFERALRKAGLSNPVHVVGDLTSAKCYMNGEGQFADRAAYPFPSILVLDLKLPDGCGLEFLRWLRSQPQFRGLRCLVVTGDLRVSAAADCHAAGGDWFIQKPCTDLDLRNLAIGFAQHWLPPPPGLEHGPESQ